MGNIYPFSGRNDSGSFAAGRFSRLNAEPPLSAVQRLISPRRWMVNLCGLIDCSFTSKTDHLIP